MPQGILIAACLSLVLSACKHREGEKLDAVNPRVDVRTDGFGDELDVTGTVDRSADSASPNLRVPVDLDMPELPMSQLWKQGALRMDVHRTATCQNPVEMDGCTEAETTYTFVRATRQLTLSSCVCGGQERTESPLTLKPAEAQQLDQLVSALEMVTGPEGACAKIDTFSWELIIANNEGIEQSFPVANGSCDGKQFGKIESKSFLKLFEYLKKIRP